MFDLFVIRNNRDYSMYTFMPRQLTVNNARATWKRKTSMTWNTRYNENVTENGVKNHCATKACVSKLRK